MRGGGTPPLALTGEGSPTVVRQYTCRACAGQAAIAHGPPPHRHGARSPDEAIRALARWRNPGRARARIPDCAALHPGYGKQGAKPMTATWPALPYAEWKDSCATLHLWTQIVGKIRLARAPWLNHSWHVALYLTARGLTTSPIPDRGGSFQIDFDFIDH